MEMNEYMTVTCKQRAARVINMLPACAYPA